MESQISEKDLLAQERRKKIIEILQKDGYARVTTLSKLFQVSEPTIRQDLDKLEQDELVVREHGGATLSSISHQSRYLTFPNSEHIDKKIKIVKKALDYINDGNSIILDSGSTTTELAKIFPPKKNIKIITNALNIAIILGTKEIQDIMVTGGEFKTSTLSLAGEKAVSFFQGIFVDKLFLATGGISSNFELTYPSFIDIRTKESMINAATEVFLLADSTKMAKPSFASLDALDKVNYLITDNEANPTFLSQIEQRGIQVIIAE